MRDKKSPSNSTQPIMKSTRELARSRTQAMLACRKSSTLPPWKYLIMASICSFWRAVSAYGRAACRWVTTFCKAAPTTSGLCVVSASHANPLSERMTRELMFGLRVLSRTAMTSGPVMPFSKKLLPVFSSPFPSGLSGACCTSYCGSHSNRAISVRSCLDRPDALLEPSMSAWT